MAFFKPFKCVCNICNSEFSEEEDLDEHYVSHSGIIKTYDCDKCSKKFLEQYKLDIHIHTVHEKDLVSQPVTYDCEYCDKFFFNEIRLQLHMQYFHSKLLGHKLPLQAGLSTFAVGLPIRDSLPNNTKMTQKSCAGKSTIVHKHPKYKRYSMESKKVDKKTKCKRYTAKSKISNKKQKYNRSDTKSKVVNKQPKSQRLKKQRAEENLTNYSVESSVSNNAVTCNKNMLKGLSILIEKIPNCVYQECVQMGSVYLRKSNFNTIPHNKCISSIRHNVEIRENDFNSPVLPVGSDLGRKLDENEVDLNTKSAIQQQNSPAPIYPNSCQETCLVQCLDCCQIFFPQKNKSNKKCLYDDSHHAELYKIKKITNSLDNANSDNISSEKTLTQHSHASNISSSQVSSINSQYSVKFSSNVPFSFNGAMSAEKSNDKETPVFSHPLSSTERDEQSVNDINKKISAKDSVVKRKQVQEFSKTKLTPENINEKNHHYVEKSANAKPVPDELVVQNVKLLTNSESDTSSKDVILNKNVPDDTLLFHNTSSNGILNTISLNVVVNVGNKANLDECTNKNFEQETVPNENNKFLPVQSDMKGKDLIDTEKEESSVASLSSDTSEYEKQTLPVDNTKQLSDKEKRLYERCKAKLLEKEQKKKEKYEFKKKLRFVMKKD